MTQHLALVADLDGKKVNRDEVLAWESRRAKKVLKLLGAPASARQGNADVLRARLFELKRTIGPAEIQRRIAARVRVGDAIGTVAARIAGGKRVRSAIRIHVPSGDAGSFADWINAESALADSDAMLEACPDHYFIGEDEQKRQKVVETTGGSPLPTEFFIDYADISSLTTPASPDYPFQVAGVARSAGGLAIGGVRHQFRNLPEGGFEAWNTIEFPNNVGNGIVSGHRWHLACEFGNWIEFQQGV
jgi:hypothetical protein